MVNSITATTDKADVISVVEPHASSIQERAAAVREARERGLRTYAMFCPLLPSIADAPEQIDVLVRFAVECGAEEIFTEPVNPRGPGLRRTQEALETHGYHAEAEAIARIRHKDGWWRYVVRLISNIQRSVRMHYEIERLRVLLYPSGLSPEGMERIQEDDAGVVWLGKNDGGQSKHVD